MFPNRLTIGSPVVAQFTHVLNVQTHKHTDHINNDKNNKVNKPAYVAEVTYLHVNVYADIPESHAPE